MKEEGKEFIETYDKQQTNKDCGTNPSLVDEIAKARKEGKSDAWIRLNLDIQEGADKK